MKFSAPLLLPSCGDIRLILCQRIDDLSDFRSTGGPEYGQRGESLASGASHIIYDFQEWEFRPGWYSDAWTLGRELDYYSELVPRETST